MSSATRSEALNAEIRAWMARRRITQSEVAGPLGVTQTQVSARLWGRIAWRVDELWIVTDLLGIDLPTLLTAAASAEQEASA